MWLAARLFANNNNNNNKRTMTMSTRRGKGQDPVRQGTQGSGDSRILVRAWGNCCGVRASDPEFMHTGHSFIIVIEVNETRL
jgi:hypothetical protein